VSESPAVIVKGWQLLLISASTSFAIGAGSVLLTGMALLGKGEAIPLILWVAAGVTGWVTAARDTRSLLSLPVMDVERPVPPPPAQGQP
jgi:hypothetical protein